MKQSSSFSRKHHTLSLQIYVRQTVRLTTECFICGFSCLTVCLSSKCNLSETFTRYGHYTGEVEDMIKFNQSKLFLKSLCQKLERLVAV